MANYNANITFETRKIHTRLLLLAALKGKTLGDTISSLVAKELKRLHIKIGGAK